MKEIKVTDSLTLKEVDSKHMFVSLHNEVTGTDVPIYRYEIPELVKHLNVLHKEFVKEEVK